MLQITHIGYRWAVAVRSPISRVNANMPDADIRYHYGSDTSNRLTVDKVQILTHHFTKVGQLSRCISSNAHNFLLYVTIALTLCMGQHLFCEVTDRLRHNFKYTAKHAAYFKASLN